MIVITMMNAIAGILGLLSENSGEHISRFGRIIGLVMQMQDVSLSYFVIAMMNCVR
jgi:hypothetical protein